MTRTTPTPGAEMRLVLDRFSDHEALRYASPSERDDLAERIAAVVAAPVAPVAPVGEDGDLAFGPETEAMIERDGHFFVLSWVKRGREFSARIYEPQMMRASPAIADALLMAFEAGSDAEKADIALSARAQPPAGEAVWKDVDGFEGLYQVSDRGDVRRVSTGHVQAKCLAGSGYVKADLWKEGQRTQTTVHRLVAKAFLAPVEGADEVNHIDGDKQNNAATNLEWSTRAANTDHSRYVLGNDVISVLATDADGSEEYYPSIEAAARLGYDASCIQMCLRGLRKTHGGKTWAKTEFRAPHPAEPAAREGGEAEVQYEVWQGDDMVASADALSDAQHYEMIYGQDGPVKLIVATTYRVPFSSPPTMEKENG